MPRSLKPFEPDPLHAGYPLLASANNSKPCKRCSRKSRIRGPMTTRRAWCACGQLRVTCEGEPVRISMCHCLEWRSRTRASRARSSRSTRRANTPGGAPSGNIMRAGIANAGAPRRAPRSGPSPILSASDPGTPGPRGPTAVRFRNRDARPRRWIVATSLSGISGRGSRASRSRRRCTASPALACASLPVARGARAVRTRHRAALPRHW